MAAIFAISTRLVEYATRLLERGSPQLVQAVETGRLAVSTASDLAELPEAAQVEMVAKGKKDALAKAREIRARRVGGKGGPDPEAWQAALRRCTNLLDRELAKLNGPDQERFLAALAGRLPAATPLQELR